MRLLNVTQSYAPFYEFGGPPLKVEALSNGLAARGHEVTVLTADWGYETRQANDDKGVRASRSPFGWTQEATALLTETAYVGIAQRAACPLFYDYPAFQLTPGASNSFAFHTEIVINEIMYHHGLLPAPNTNSPPQGSAEQWLELYNRSTNTVDLTGWDVPVYRGELAE